jgi:hypothetical protein
MSMTIPRPRRPARPEAVGQWRGHGARWTRLAAGHRLRLQHPKWVQIPNCTVTPLCGWHREYA